MATSRMLCHARQWFAHHQNHSSWLSDLYAQIPQTAKTAIHSDRPRVAGEKMDTDNYPSPHLFCASHQRSETSRKTSRHGKCDASGAHKWGIPPCSFRSNPMTVVENISGTT